MGLSPIAPGTGSHFFGVQAWHGIKLEACIAFCLNKKSINLWVHYYPCYRGLTCGAFALSFVLIQKKQKIKENPPVGGQAPIAPRLSGPARGKSQWIDIIFFECVSAIRQR